MAIIPDSGRSSAASRRTTTAGFTLSRHDRDYRGHAPSRFGQGKNQAYGVNRQQLKCPAGRRLATCQSTSTTKKGSKVPGARTFSMNQAVGTVWLACDGGSAPSGIPNRSTKAPWLGDGGTGGYKTFGKDSDFDQAAMTLTILDRDSDTQKHPSARQVQVSIRWRFWWQTPPRGDVWITLSLLQEIL